MHVKYIFSTDIEMDCLDSFTGDVLATKMRQLFSQSQWVSQEVDDEVNAVGDTDEMGAPFRAVGRVDMDPREQVLCLGEATEQAVLHTQRDSNGLVTMRVGLGPE